MAIYFSYYETVPSWLKLPDDSREDENVKSLHGQLTIGKPKSSGELKSSLKQTVCFRWVKWIKSVQKLKHIIYGNVFIDPRNISNPLASYFIFTNCSTFLNPCELL